MSAAVDHTFATSEGLETKKYWEHFGLSIDPFASEVDLSTYYALPRWEEHIDLLQYLCHYNNVLALVLGVSGIGKSLLMAQIVSQVADTMTVAAVQADPALDIQRLTEIFATGFGAPWQPELSFDQQLEEQLQAIQLQDRICLLLIDDAHLLPNETLAALLDMLHQQSEAQMRLHVILFGEPQLHDHLTHLCDDEDDSLLHVLVLEPLSFEETERYLVHRLQTAAWEEGLPFGQEALIRIYRLAEGIPARINRIARRMLFESLNRRYQSEESQVGFFEAYKTKILGAVVVMLMGALTVFSVNLFSHKRPSHPKTVVAFQDQVLLPQKETMAPALPAAVSDANNVQPTPNAAPSASASAPVVLQPGPVMPATAQSDAPINAAKPSQALVSVPTTNTPPAPTISNQEAQPSPGKIATTSNVSGVKLQNPVSATATKVTPIAAVVSQPPAVLASFLPTPATKAVSATTDMVVPIAAAEHASLSQDVSKKKTKKKVGEKFQSKESNNANYSSAERWFLDQANNHYTIQLIGLSYESSVKQFIAQNGLGSEARYFQTSLHGNPFFILLYGNYPNKEAAAHAIAGLPAGVRAHTPWERSFASVKRSINRHMDKLPAHR